MKIPATKINISEGKLIVNVPVKLKYGRIDTKIIQIV
jgi:hypothetical protein